MLLPFTSTLTITTHFDPEMAMLADRHYSRQSKGSRQFTCPARKLILRDAGATVLFAWTWQKYRRDGQQGYNCSIFRNESNRLSSDIILEAEHFAVEKWGVGRAFTMIDPQKIASKNPGYCFKRAGWKLCGRTKNGKLILEKDLVKG